APPTASELYYPTAEPRCEPLSATVPAPEGASDYERFVSTVVSVALESGATRVAAALTKFFRGGALLMGELSPESQAALVREGFASESAGTLRLTTGAERTAAAWRRALSGETQDLEGCGDSMLDAWAASFLGACLAHDAAGIDRLRRVLRRRGVAAFGMLAA